jgi:hypothetical protein
LRRSGPGKYAVSFGPQDREVLRALPVQLAAAMVAKPDDDVFRRLHPPAYADDAHAEQDYREMVRSELDENRTLALETLAKTADATELTAEELDAWLRALNYIRLWLGTMLDITEDQVEEEPEDPAHLLYHLLTAWQELAVSVLSGEG